MNVILWARQTKSLMTVYCEGRVIPTPACESESITRFSCRSIKRGTLHTPNLFESIKPPHWKAKHLHFRNRSPAALFFSPTYLITLFIKVKYTCEKNHPNTVSRMIVYCMCLAWCRQSSISNKKFIFLLF